MKYVDEYRDRKLVKQLVDRIHHLARRSKEPLTFMEVCGTHTMAMFRYGFRQLLPNNVRIISGPGCPVCVTSQQDIDTAIALASRAECIVTTFGDMLKVPGTETSLGALRSNNRIRVVYSVLDALEISRQHPKSSVVHIAVGFETTAPTTAAALQRAKEENLKNFFVLCTHKLVPPALQALLSRRNSRIDGFILPGHVSVIIGTEGYAGIKSRKPLSGVIAGFEATDMLQAIALLIEQKSADKPEIAIQYRRCVHAKGNPVARELLSLVFRPVDTEWRGLGVIKRSGLALRPQYQRFDILRKIKVRIPRPRRTGCRCGEVLQGVIEPAECRLYGKPCTPEQPVGPCMVSSEGTCAAHYRYGGVHAE